MSRAFETLEADERIVLVLRFWNDLRVEEIAERVGIPAGAVKSRLHNATDRLRSALTIQGGKANLAILGLAGTCATSSPARSDATSEEIFEVVPIVYEQLTIWHSLSFGLPYPVVVTMGRRP